MPDAELTVMTFNLYGTGEGEFAFDRRANLVADTIAAVNPDVLCLQEVPSDQFLRALMAMFQRRLGKPMRVATTSVDRADGTAFRIALFHPGTRKVATWLRTDDGRRVGIEVHLGNRALPVICTHFESTDAALRSAQAGLIAERASRHESVLVCGDLNAGPGSPDFDRLTGPLERLAPAADVTHTFPTGLRPEHARRAPEVFDHILGKGVSVVESGVVGLDADSAGLWPSDHGGTWAKVSIG